MPPGNPAGGISRRSHSTAPLLKRVPKCNVCPSSLTRAFNQQLPRARARESATRCCRKTGHSDRDAEAWNELWGLPETGAFAKMR